MKKILCFFMCLFVVSGCSFIDNDDSNITDVVFKSYDGRFELVASSNWEEVSEKGTLNELAEIELADSKNQKYIIVLVEAKEDFSWSYDQYSDYIIKQNSEIYGVTIDQVNTINVNDYEIDYVEFKTVPDGINIYMRLYVIETDNYYGQVLMWTKYSQREEVVDEFDKIVSTFREVEK